MMPDNSAVPSAANVRAATINDVHNIHGLIEQYARMGNLLPRPVNELYRHLRDFYVVESSGEIVACGALEIFTDTLAEVRSLVVAQNHKGQGFGRLLVEKLLTETQSLGLKKLMALTYVPEFFHKMGFITVDKHSLPEKVWGICAKCYKYHNCDETAVVKEFS